MFVKTGYPQAEKKKSNPDTALIPFTKINLKWNTVLNIKCKIIKLLEGNTGENLDDAGRGDDSLDVTPKIQFMEETTNKLDFIKKQNKAKKTFCPVKDNQCQENEKTIHRLKENIYKRHVW